MNKFSIEDEVHAEWQGDFSTFEDALNELKRRSKIPWNQEPNKCPFISWESCERIYTISEVEIGDETYSPIREAEVLNVSSKGVIWLKGFENYADM
ncbi:hypothetical protein GCM10011352_35590 [Marinobacterium zhoushanense]|uniref:Uncharacterized protein n=1 Tax=Marinobacterium zhoushanense TaxID=1679163 RepID=A0ABQ1KUT2_9GAMM|nr:hypothetical protein [Marinobacterium zhoushanense]GGC06232.1 hypothetical protein GCM10011352_35590 [Marinobacterium zhoushanense]